MHRLTRFALFFLLVPGDLPASSFGIDFSPLREPGFGKRRDYETSTGSAPVSTRAEAQRSSELTNFERTLGRAGERLARDIIPLPNSWLDTSGHANFRRLSATYGDTIFNVGTLGREIFSVPVDYRPPVRPVEDRLPAAASILQSAANNSGLSNEDRAFLAGQAVFALEGQPLQVVVEPSRSLPPTAIALERFRKAWTAVASALNAVQNAQTARKVAEAATPAIPIDPHFLINRGKVSEEIQQRYLDAVQVERLAREKLRIARTELTEAVKVIQGEIVIRD